MSSETDAAADDASARDADATADAGDATADGTTADGTTAAGTTDGGYVHVPGTDDGADATDGGDGSGDLTADADGPTADGFGREGWALTAAIFTCALVIPGIIYVYPYAAGWFGLPFFATYLALPLVPAVLLGLVAVWSMTAATADGEE